MVAGMEMSGRMPARRVVAAAHVTARLAHPQVDPVATDPQAVLAALGAGLDVGDGLEVCALHGWQRRCRRSRRAPWELHGARCPFGQPLVRPGEHSRETMTPWLWVDS